ncbi:MAG: tRNA threonylcarbamoyladenosine dehydratase [Cyanobacteriota bacterium]
MNNNFDLNLIYLRNKLIWGEETQNSLWNKHIVILGLGGVGSYAVEALARSGIGNLSLVDFDRVTITNFNRQLLASTNYLDQLKTDAMEARIFTINPEINVIKYPLFYDSSHNETLFKNTPDFVVDAIDSTISKMDLIEYCIKNNINIVSSFGAANRLDPSKLFITDISETKGLPCPFAKKLRTNLKKRNILKGLPVVTSNESPVKPDYSIVIDDTDKSKPPASSPFVPPVAGFILASYVIRKLISG